METNLTESVAVIAKYMQIHAYALSIGLIIYLLGKNKGGPPDDGSLMSIIS